MTQPRSACASALLGWCLAACISGGALAHAHVDAKAPRGPAMFLAADEEPVPGAAWTEAVRVAAYLRLHHADEDSAVRLYPLAAYISAARGGEGDAVRARRPGHHAAARGTAAVAARGVPRLP